MAIFIKKLKIQNYKCFENEPIDFSVPNGNRGSGLNILIGENGNGKTTVLEAINYLTLNNFSAENKLSINDFRDFKNEIIIEAETDEFNCESTIDAYKFNSWSFKGSGITFTAKNRDTKERGKLLSSPFQISSHFRLVNDQYAKGDGSTATDKDGNIKNVDGRDKIFGNAKIGDDDELNIFFFDKNRTRQISVGNYKTTFEKICDDLNWSFVKNLNDENSAKILQSIVGEYFKNVDDIAKKSFGQKTAKDLKEFFDKKEFEKIKIELLNILHPFSNSFFALRNDDCLSQINIRDLGSGVEIVLTLLLLKNIAGASKGSIIYLIDEPELHLHPKAQDKLLDFLLEESKNKQIIVSTHSPYLFKGAISQNASLLLFTRDENNKIKIENARDKGWGLFPGWSPSWGEINYFAYDMPTIEFHDELYGSLHERYIGSSTDQIDADKRSKQTDFEINYLQTKLSKEKKWTPEFGGQAKNEEDVTLPTFIRNKSHHPENKTMQSNNYSDEEIKKSIQLMVDLVKNP
ncbi:MAG: AAA family ATPase [Patescibacteria group bacterium]|nr:AAA family ATPase [Patescibacteria group bacterium]